MQGGLDGWLREEFRAQNYLNEITRMEYEGLLPDTIARIPVRGEQIDVFREWVRTDKIEDGWHPKLKALPHEFPGGMPGMPGIQGTKNLWLACPGNLIFDANSQGLPGIAEESESILKTLKSIVKHLERFSTPLKRHRVL
ncbi:hypothetical protein BKA70DRAFT_1238722 [Coprinopsis sp. MPI-PUGE-AT-0042]|nr:hypothetical protein BKA70DRAFT_1238722 [Coprinopsis sp. MPI-PUGE-AT-0042]